MTDPTPDSVRAAILKAADTLATVGGTLPIMVSFPLMQADGPDSIAARLWNNAWNLKNTNSARVWLPDHPAVVRRLR